MNLTIVSARPAIAAGLSRCLAIKFGPATVLDATAFPTDHFADEPQPLLPDADVVIIDSIGLHGALRTLRNSDARDALKVLVLVPQPSDYILEQYRREGANAVLSERDGLADWERVLSRMAGHTFQAGSSFAEGPRIIPLLTARQRDVYGCVIRGMTDEAIAGHLAISVSTAETHRRDLMQKLGCHSHREVVMHAVRLGIVGPGELRSSTAERHVTRRHDLSV